MKKRKKKGGAAKLGRVRSAKGASEFDREFIVDTFGAPSASERARFERARLKPGRPRRGQGAHVISVSVERGLLEDSDRLARNLGITRAGLIARGLKAVLAADGQR